jgi:4-hydroxybenzoate polyprenyltransferase
MFESSGERSIAGRVEQYLRLMRVDRPVGSMLLLWPTLWAVWIASQGRPEPRILAIFVSGVFLMRSAGCVINDYADRDMDPHVERTRDRPLASGRVSAPEALALFAVLSGAALALVLTLNALTVMLSLVGAFWAVIYPFMKRFVHVPQLFLGFAFSWGIPMAFSAQTGGVPAIAWVLLAANMAWVMAYDTMYAMSDRRDDLIIGVKSTAILFGEKDRLIVGCCQGLTLALLTVAGIMASLDLYFYCSLVAAGVFFVYQQWLIRHRGSQDCFRAFSNNTWSGALVFFGIVLSYL